ncbi:MAG: hypothetical protein DSM106950_23610 [Stigonema ocellatum SAG 48.90 = DSM 106950]|nr:hypothetical protein [Stigonema ocellatum SAG 48.90 = DSM 106950]
MTDDARFDDLNQRLQAVEQRVGETWERATINTDTIAGMQQLVQGLVTIAIAQQQSTASLERSVGQLVESVRTHDRQIQQILQYLRERNGGSSPPA